MNSKLFARKTAVILSAGTLLSGCGPEMRQESTESQSRAPVASLGSCAMNNIRLRPDIMTIEDVRMNPFDYTDSRATETINTEKIWQKATISILKRPEGIATVVKGDDGSVIDLGAAYGAVETTHGLHDSPDTVINECLDNGSPDRPFVVLAEDYKARPDSSPIE
jgi:hypothetical protein